MLHIQRYAVTAVMLALLFGLMSCGGSGVTQTPSEGQQSPRPFALPKPPPAQPGVSMPTLQPDGFDVDNPERSASAVYRIFFRDAVNNQSAGRWSVTNTSGQKQWTLSNTNFSTPKAWVLGGNYWNREDDELTSDDFAVEDGEDGLALTFMSRWSIAADDNGTVYFWDGGAWQQVVNFTGGTNPSYPNWDKYYFQLPANTSGGPQTCFINFAFTSDIAINGWGFGVDSIAVYQTQLGQPGAFAASDGTVPSAVDLSWTNNPVGNLTPDEYHIYRADDAGGSPGAYNFLDAVTYPADTYTDQTGNTDTYWYKVEAVKPGWPPIESTEDSGFGDVAQWILVNAATAGTPSEFTSLAVVDGRPAVCYYDEDTFELRYAFSSTATGTNAADWTNIVIDDSGDAGWYNSLEVVDGKPAISYYDLANFDLKYAYSSTASGGATADWTTITIDSAGTVGQHTSLAVVDGTPAISYYDATNDVLKFAFSSTAQGGSIADWTTITVDSGGDVGQETSLAVIDGKPAISYVDATNSELKFAFSSTAGGEAAGDWSSIVVDSPSVGAYTSLALVDGKPAISYWDFGNNDLKYAFSSTAGGGAPADWTSITLDSTGNVGTYTSLHVVDGNPAISYRDGTNSDLKYAFSSTVGGGAIVDWTIETVDSAGLVGWATSLAEVDGSPGISYIDFTNGSLKFAIFR